MLLDLLLDLLLGLRLDLLLDLLLDLRLDSLLDLLPGLLLDLWICLALPLFGFDILHMFLHDDSLLFTLTSITLSLFMTCIPIHTE